MCSTAHSEDLMSTQIVLRYVGFRTDRSFQPGQYRFTAQFKCNLCSALFGSKELDAKYKLRVPYERILDKKVELMIAEFMEMDMDLCCEYLDVLVDVLCSSKRLFSYRKNEAHPAPPPLLPDAVRSATIPVGPN